uniref:HTH_48 domain-containing protein n=1 Tax=Caenorhabditis tropicalis TaxID=1561998 RepID=A0A1I7TBY2_9PELO
MVNIEEEADSPGKVRKEKSLSMPEDAGMLLVELYIRDEKKYNERSQGGCKRGRTPRQQWQQDLAAIGCDRTVEQVTKSAVL